MTGCARATVYRTVYRFESFQDEAVYDRRRQRSAEKMGPAMAERLLGYLDGVP